MYQRFCYCSVQHIFCKICSFYLYIYNIQKRFISTLYMYICIHAYTIIYHSSPKQQQNLQNMPNTHKIPILLLFLIFLFIHQTSSTTVTLSHLQTFFNYTYDRNHDNHATIQQFLQYFQEMQPQHNLTLASIKQTFDMFDSNSDMKITLKELVEIAKIRVQIGEGVGHRQIHLGLTDKQGEMLVMWVTTPTSVQKPVVHYGRYPTQLNQKVYAIASTYNVGHMGFHGTIYKAVLRNLQPQTRYYYKVGDQHSLKYSPIKFFKGPPSKGQQLPQINIAVFGDMGTFAPFGHLVMSQIVRDNLVKPFDFVFLTGDIAYAGMGSQKNGQTEPIWDLFGQLSESFAAYCPFMPGVGNHEKYYDYAAYHARYDLPKIYNGQTNLWFSFDYGQVHVIHFSSQHPYEKGSQQYAFLEQDMRQAHENPNTKWIILGVHRAFYSSDKTQYAVITHLTAALEQLVNKYKVDIVQTGHLHSYQRSWPTYRAKAQKQGHEQNHFKSPQAPIYVVQGTSGALINQKWVDPKPEWSIKRMLKYGYGRILIKGNTLKYQYVEAANGKILDEFLITK